MSQLLVIGGASSDILHLADRTVACAGGAGMYTAMAAHRCGVQVALFAPRPDPYPEPLLPVTRRLADWLGPVVPPEQLPAGVEDCGDLVIKVRHPERFFREIPSLVKDFGANVERLEALDASAEAVFDYLVGSSGFSAEGGRF